MPQPLTLCCRCKRQSNSRSTNLSLCVVDLSPCAAGAPIQPAVIAATTELLAKSEADELLEEFFINFPTLFTGICLAFFVVQYIQSSQLNSLVPDLPFPFEFFVIPSFVIVFVLAGKFGVLGSISAVVAKASLDAWDVFAAAVLPGAILKY